MAHVCDQCGSGIENKRADARYCSSLCSSRAFNRRRQDDGRLAKQRSDRSHERSEWLEANRHRYMVKRECLACSGPFVVHRQSPTRTCSVPCRTMLTTGHWPSSRLPWKTCPGCGARRLARGRVDPRCETCWRPSVRKAWISPSRRCAIYERDGWICQLCTEAIDGTVDPESNWAPSLDHIVPRSRGGDHSDSNLRLAHRWCNSVRGDETYYTAADLVA